MIAIFCHIFYSRTWTDIRERLRNFPFPFNLYINLVEGHSSPLLNIIVAEFPSAKIQISPNQGMDPGGQLCTLNYWLKEGENEDFLIFIHSKNDDSLRDLMMSIITPEKARKAMELFNDPQVGMVGVQEWNLYPPKMYSAPIHFCDYYCEKLGLNNFETNRFGFIGGTQFWVRSSIYRKVFQNAPILDIVGELPPYETGSKTHALERIFGYIVLSEGFKIEGV